MWVYVYGSVVILKMLSSSLQTRLRYSKLFPISDKCTLKSTRSRSLYQRSDSAGGGDVSMGGCLPLRTASVWFCTYRAQCLLRKISEQMIINGFALQ